MTIQTISNEFKKNNINTVVVGDDFLEFKGIVTNSNNVKFDVEGTVEYSKKEKELAYSISILDVEKNEEVFSDCGSYMQITENEVAKKVLEIICCDFEEI